MFLELLRRESEGDPALMAAALAGLRAYQEAPRAAPMPPMPAVAEAAGAVLRDYGGAGNDASPPLVFVPSLINPPSIADLSPDRSLLRWLAARGHRVLLLDWGWPGAGREGLDVAAHVETILLPLLDAVGTPADVVGYCLGGTMAIAAAALRPVRSLAAIAAPWHFGGFPSPARADLAALWNGAKAPAQALGLLPMEVLQSAFWSLDAGRTVGKFAAFAERDLDSPAARAFVALEDWANDGPPIPYAAARELFEDFFAADRPGTDGWRVAGTAIDPAAIPAPILNIVSTSDRIVPAASAPRAGMRLDLAPGHVGMVVGSRARAALWEPLDAFLTDQA